MVKPRRGPQTKSARASNDEIEQLWIDAWNDLYAIVQERCGVLYLLPDGEVVDVEVCQGWLQDSAYSGYVRSGVGLR